MIHYGPEIYLGQEVCCLVAKIAFSLFKLTSAHRWKQLRPMLSPTFTSSKMKLMFTLIDACAQHFTEYFIKDGQRSAEVELKDAFSRFTNDVIATTAFGIECDSLQVKNNEFYLMGKDITNFSGLFNQWKLVGLAATPRLMKVVRYILVVFTV